jgi:hypothetical protein
MKDFCADNAFAYEAWQEFGIKKKIYSVPFTKFLTELFPTSSSTGNSPGSGAVPTVTAPTAPAPAAPAPTTPAPPLTKPGSQIP